ncbi:MAG: sulfotransferase [Planctomycetota bacterium]|nr:sulfotransferase family protein [Planctomycetota bacterium]
MGIDSNAEPFLVIVSGLPRSGTSMMMKMLESGGVPVLADDQRKADIDNVNGYYEFQAALKIKQDNSWLADSDHKAVKMVYQLLYELPETHQYRVLMMRRSMDEVLASQKKMLARLGKPTDTIPDSKMAEIFNTGLAKFYAWIAQRPNFRIVDIDYNIMVADPIPQIQVINRLLGGGLDEQAMAEVVQPDLYRNRKS